MIMMTKPYDYADDTDDDNDHKNDSYTTAGAGPLVLAFYLFISSIWNVKTEFYKLFNIMFSNYFYLFIFKLGKNIPPCKAYNSIK